MWCRVSSCTWCIRCAAVRARDAEDGERPGVFQHCLVPPRPCLQVASIFAMNWPYLRAVHEAGGAGWVMGFMKGSAPSLVHCMSSWIFLKCSILSRYEDISLLCFKLPRFTLWPAFLVIIALPLFSLTRTDLKRPLIRCCLFLPRILLSTNLSACQGRKILCCCFMAVCIGRFEFWAIQSSNISLMISV